MARILLIEDNADNRELMTYLLDAFGHETAVAEDGGAGIAALDRGTFDLIVCDIHLPKMDGYAVLAAIRVRPSMRSVPVIAVTALAMVGDRERVLAAGFDGYVGKPVEPEAFAAEIASFLPTPGGAARAVRLEHSTAAHAPASPAPAARRVLVVDDILENREFLRAVLEPNGYAVATCESAVEALALAGRESFDLVLSDLRMPDRDGLDLLVSLKSDAALRDVPFLIITVSRWTDAERERAFTLGAAAFMNRPIEAGDLLAEIAACVPKAGN